MNKRLISLLVGAVAAGSVTSVSPAQAITWNLNSVKYLFGNASASGSFDYDAVSNTYSNVSISTTFPNALTFTTANIYGASSSSALFLEIDTEATGTQRYQGLRLTFNTPLTNTLGLTIPINTTGGASVFYTRDQSLYNGAGNTFDITNGSSISSVPFDIPGGATIPTVGSLLALGAMRQVKKKMVAKNIAANPVSEPVK